MPTINVSRMNRRSESSQVVFGDVEYKPGGECGPRIQPDVQLVVIHHGEACITIDDTEQREVSANHAALLLPGHNEMFHFATRTDTRHSWCAIDPEALPKLFQEELRKAPSVQPLSGRVHSLIEMGLSVLTDGTTDANALLVSIGATLLQTYLFDAAYAANAKRTPQAISRAQQYIEAHFGESITLSTLAGAANVTPQHLTRLFQHHLQITPMRYVWHLRTVRGADLLRETGLSINEIADQCGFQSPFHFSRLVRQEYDCPPRMLRNRWWHGNSTETE